MVKSVAVNPAVLRWARDSMNLSHVEVARRLKKKPEEIAAWEDGTQAPTYVQLERLAYELYKRPLAVFFFPRPPDEEGLRTSFRTLPEFEFERLPPRVLSLIRDARVRQMRLRSMLEGRPLADKSLLHDFAASLGASIEQTADSLRRALPVTMAEQAQWANPQTAFEEWRSKVESQSVLVFKDAFRQDEISGFCLFDQVYPLIFLNNSIAHTRQCFTLFHELGHLLLRTGGIDKINDDYLSALSGEDAAIERFCNELAAEVLVPRRDFEEVSRGVTLTEDSIGTLAKRYSVSREVILRRFKDAGAVPQAMYEALSQKWTGEAIRARGGPPGGNYYATQRTYLGKRFIDVAFRQYYTNRIDLYQLADYLGMKVDSVRRLESELPV